MVLKAKNLVNHQVIYLISLFNNLKAGAGINTKWKNKSKYDSCIYSKGELFRAAMKAARTGKAVEMPIDEDLHQCPH